MFQNIGYFIPVLLSGTVITVAVSVGGIVLCTILSFVAGLTSLARSKTARVITRIYVEGWRGTSEVVQLFWIYFAVPLLIGLQLVPLWAGVLVLGLNHGAYGAEIVRGAVRSVPREQHEGSVALNFTPYQRMRRVILPQALVDMVPPFNNLFIQLLKASSLVSLITLPDITYQGQQILVPRYGGQTFLIFMLMLVLYLILAVLITLGMRFLERRAARIVGRRAEPAARLFGRGPAELSIGGGP